MTFVLHSESPFEFRALEVALEAICSYLAARTTELETAAYPALDELTSKVSIPLFMIELCCLWCCCQFPGLLLSSITDKCDCASLWYYWLILIVNSLYLLYHAD